MEADTEVVTTQAKPVRQKSGLAIVIKREIRITAVESLHQPYPSTALSFFPIVLMAHPRFSGQTQFNISGMEVVPNNILSSSFSTPLPPIHDLYTLHVRPWPEIGLPERSVS